MKKKNLNSNIKQKGFALIWALLMSMIIMIMASSMVILVVKELRITSNIDQSNRAYLAAEAGIERGMYFLKKQSFGWCEDYNIPSPGYYELDSANPGALRYLFTIKSTKVGGACDTITIESTGTESSTVNRKLKLTIFYGPSNNIDKYDISPYALDPSYPFPGGLGVGSTASKPLIVQQFDIWDLNNTDSIVVGMEKNNNDSNNGFGVKITGGSLANLSLAGKMNNLSINSNNVSFSTSGNPPFRVVLEYSKTGTNYTIARAIVLKKKISAGLESFICIDNTKSYVVYGSVNTNGFDPEHVKTHDIGSPSPSWEYLGGNGYLQYPNGVKIDNMVFWGRE